MDHREFLNNAAPFFYKVDALQYESLENADLKKHIDVYGKVIYRRSAQ